MNGMGDFVLWQAVSMRVPSDEKTADFTSDPWNNLETISPESTSKAIA